jgi:hypothetical protein
MWTRLTGRSFGVAAHGGSLMLAAGWFDCSFLG